MFMIAARLSRFREIARDRADEFFYRGYKRRLFFPHRIYYLPKCGPDGFKLANSMCGDLELDQLWETVIYATPPLIHEFPKELFFDDDLIWHQQQFGKIGQIATANLVVDGDRCYSMVHISDLVQRISRRREYKTRIENRFKGWNHMLLNSTLNFALENNLKTVYSPTSDLAIENTDPSRNVGREMFERIYDRNVHDLFRADKQGRWWVIDVNENKDRIVVPEAKQELIPAEKTICLCHDIERGFGHVDVDPDFARFAHETSQANLEEMLLIEEESGVETTYNVLGLILNAVRASIEKNGHSIAFHSYNHQIEKSDSPRVVDLDQLSKCRELDYRIKGYRPPQSRITAELSDENLSFHNFEWLANWEYSRETIFPKMRNRIVKIPILFDDFDIYSNGMEYERWEENALESIKQNDFVAFCLHDCYGQFWLPHYRRFLDKIRSLGKLRTLNEVASEVILSNAN